LFAEKKLHNNFIRGQYFSTAVNRRNCHGFEKRIGSGSLKPSTNRMLNRIKCIYMFICKNGTVSTQQLVEEFGITPRTIQRDLNVLAYNDLVISPSRGKWTTTQKKVKMTS
jgi:predicted HTH transcriptional regulator